MHKIIMFLIFGYVTALTDEELKSQFIKILLDCNKDSGVEMTELLLLEQHIVPKNPKTKCLLACAYRKVGTLNSKGLYDLEGGYKLAETQLDTDKRIENGKKMADICSKVNTLNVSDGEKGCDRAAYMFKCLIDNHEKFGFKI